MSRESECKIRDTDRRTERGDEISGKDTESERVEPGTMLHGTEGFHDTALFLDLRPG